MIKVLVNGAAGRMGQEVVKAVAAQEDMAVAASDPAGGPATTGIPVPLVWYANLEHALSEFKPDVMVDFTRPNVVEGNIRRALATGVHTVVGTTGLSDEELREIYDDYNLWHQSNGEGTPANLFVAPNFAIGAVLMMQLAAQAARYLPEVEIIELHHDKKVDAPSGTALRTAELIKSNAKHRCMGGTLVGAGTGSGPKKFRSDQFPSRGLLAANVNIHSVRLPGLVAHQEVLFGGQGQTLSIRHDSIDRTSFMPGVVLAVREVGNHPGLTVGLENLMEA